MHAGVGYLPQPALGLGEGVTVTVGVVGGLVVGGGDVWVQAVARSAPASSAAINGLRMCDPFTGC
ncbi:hypothetical protein DKM19_01255 [Streptosporangium sp. 'caverna']|nr:hypothetical protein DKM19_01255 [Streptosporangium sp. 'caverna']